MEKRIYGALVQFEHGCEIRGSVVLEYSLASINTDILSELYCALSRILMILLSYPNEVHTTPLVVAMHKVKGHYERM